MRGQHHAVRQAVPAAVPVAQLLHRREVLLEERGAVLLVGEVDVGLDRGAGDLLAVVPRLGPPGPWEGDPCRDNKSCPGRGHPRTCSRTSRSARAVSSCTKKWPPGSVTSSPRARAACSANQSLGRSLWSPRATVAGALRASRWRHAAGAPGGSPDTSKIVASTSGGHASSTCPSARSTKPQRT